MIRPRGARSTDRKPITTLGCPADFGVARPVVEAGMVFPIGDTQLYIFRLKDGQVERHRLTFKPRSFQDRELRNYQANYVSCAPFDEWEELGCLAHQTQHFNL